MMADSAADDNNNEERMIHPIEQESVQRIVAGQAVNDLATAVKELVDNALDANSKSINIRLFNQGLDIVEVSDDGTGVPPASRPFLAQAHATSKIRSFEDIYQSSACSTLGFRGEALFCLANLSDRLIVATRTADEPVGQKMEFRHDGSLDPQTMIITPRKVGTTVAVVKLLNSLPVRRADLERRIVQHRSKMMRLMEGYAIFSVGVRINLMDVVRGKENTLLATTANSIKLEQTISSVLGSKFLASVTPLSVDLTSVLDPASPKGDWKIEGFISKPPGDPAATVAAAKAGQQFFSINGRPVELPKLARIIGEVYRSLGGKKKPSCILTLVLPNQEYDVNLSPEKRQVQLTNEDAICQELQNGINNMWASQTEGQFVASASQLDSKAKPQSDNPLKGVPPKIDNIASLAKIQESNRKRALEKYAQEPSVALLRKQDDEEKTEDAMMGDPRVEDDNNYGSSSEDDEDHDPDDPHAAGRRAYIRKFRQEQKEQHKLNASATADCQYGDEAEEQNVPTAPALETSPSGRVRRRGGFVHDISTAKQWERNSNTGNVGLKIPEGIEDPDASDEEETAAIAAAAAQTQSHAKKRRTNFSQPPTAKESSPVPTEDVATLEDQQSSSRRVTLPNTNDQAEVPPSIPKELASSSVESLTMSTTEAATDGEKLRWMDVQARFNNDEEQGSPEKELDRLAKTSVSPSNRVFETPRPQSTIRLPSNSTQPVLNLAQFAFQREFKTTNAQPARSLGMTKQPAVSPEEPDATQRQCSEADRYAKTPTASMERISQTPPTSDTSSLSRRRQRQDPCETPMSSREVGSSTPRSVEGLKSRPSKNEPCDVVWEDFKGTEDVVMAARAERQRMLERKRSIQRARSTRDYQGDEDMDEEKRSKPNKISLNKGDFADMKVLAQFNLGFMVAIDKRNHLWLFDQHACDERAQFEHLVAVTVIHEQPLISPLPLELDPSEESCILDNMEIFEKNGFRFKYDETKPPRHRFFLTALPHSGARYGRKAVNFGKEDVSALCAILGANSSHDEGDHAAYGIGGGGGTGVDGSGIYGNNAVRRYAGSSSQVLTCPDEADKVITRLPKAISMFASRACRGSIMIGTGLSRREMEKLVRKLSELKDPWKCAHGRPTMTHVADLHSILLEDERSAAAHFSGPTVSMSLSQMEVEDP